MYDNCKIISSDGTELSYCDRKRAEWYLKRGLATRVQDEPLHIKLNFAHRQGSYDSYALAVKENKCCVCGSTSELTKHHVVPYSYRKLFPAYIKEHCCHDVVCLCVTCHRKYELQANEYKQKLLVDYGIDIEYLRGRYHLYRKAVGIAQRALNDQPVNTLLPVMIYLGKSQVDKSDFHSILEEKQENLDWFSGASLVLQKITDLEGFIKGWRCHFIETMQPKYMPEMWSVDYQR